MTNIYDFHHDPGEDDLALIRKHEDILKAWVEKAYSKADKVDPGQELYWGHLLIGFLLACDLSPEEALKLELALHYTWNFM